MSLDRVLLLHIMPDEYNNTSSSTWSSYTAASSSSGSTPAVMFVGGKAEQHTVDHSAFGSFVSELVSSFGSALLGEGLSANCLIPNTTTPPPLVNGRIDAAQAAAFAEARFAFPQVTAQHAAGAAATTTAAAHAILSSAAAGGSSGSSSSRVPRDPMESFLDVAFVRDLQTAFAQQMVLNLQHEFVAIDAQAKQVRTYSNSSQYYYFYYYQYYYFLY